MSDGRCVLDERYRHILENNEIPLGMMELMNDIESLELFAESLENEPESDWYYPDSDDSDSPTNQLVDSGKDEGGRDVENEHKTGCGNVGAERDNKPNPDSSSAQSEEHDGGDSQEPASSSRSDPQASPREVTDINGGLPGPLENP